MTKLPKDIGTKDKIIITLILLLILVLGALVLVGSFKIAGIERAIEGAQFAETKVIRGIDGHDGYTPIKGVDYVDGVDGLPGVQGEPGRDSKSTHTVEREVIIKEVPVPGPAGKDGKDGKPASLLKVVVDPLTCILGTTYEGDDFVLDIVRLPKPCEVL